MLSTELSEKNIEKPATLEATLCDPFGTEQK